MSRHRAVRNLDLDEEFYDDDYNDSSYDGLHEMSEEDQLRMLEGIEAVKKELGGSGISDQEIKETLWYYYFDEKASVAWLQKTHNLQPKGNYIDSEILLSSAQHRPIKPPSTKTTTLKGLAKTKKPGVSVVGKALSALKTTPAREGRSPLSQLASLRRHQQPGSSQTKLPSLKNFAGRKVPTLREISSKDPSDKADKIDRTKSGPALDIGTLKRHTTSSLYAKPSILASFILNNNKKKETNSFQREMESAAVVAELRKEIRDVSFLHLLALGSPEPFNFDTPSPDDRVLEAQSQAAPGSSKK